MRYSFADLDMVRIARQVSPSRTAARGNRWRGFLSTASVIGAVFFSLTASAASLEPLPAELNETTHAVTIGVRASSDLEGYPVRFLLRFQSPEGEATLGGAYITDGVARLTLVGFPLGIHSLRAVCFGCLAGLALYTPVFTINVQELGGLPAVLENLLSD